MKILVIGDIHFRNWPQFSTIDPETGLNTRFLDSLRILEWAERLSRKVDLVVQVGDIFDCRTKTENDVAVHAVQAFKQFSTSVIALVGNHDCWGHTAAENTLGILPSNIQVIAYPQVIDVKGVRILLHPFTPDLDKFKAWCKNHSGDLFFFHQGLNEAEVGAYHLSIPAALSYKDLPDTRFRLGGHIHAPQEVAPGTIIVGSTNQFNFGERNEEKRVIILDTDTWDFTSVPTEAPQFYLYPSVTAANKGKHRECDFIRIQCSKSEVESVKESFPTAHIEVVRELKKEKRVLTEATVQSDDSLLTAYLNEKRPELDKDRLLKLGKELLEE